MSPEKPIVAIVDDEEPVRRALQRLMRSAGLETEVYASGPEFLLALESRRPDCVVLDLQMPGMSGFEVQERLAAAKSRIPVLILTAHDTPEADERAMRSGAAADHRKPVDRSVLLRAVVAAVAAAERERSS